MQKEEIFHPAGSKLWQKFNRLLFEPHFTITEASNRREAYFLSVINFFLAVLGLAGVISTWKVYGVSRNVFILAGFVVAATFAYIISRTHYHKIGSYLIVWTLVFIAFGGGEASRLTNSLYVNLILAFVIASISFPFRYMVFFVILINLVISLLPFAYPQFTDTWVVLGSFVPFSLLMLAIMRYHTNAENDRLKESRKFNRELTILKNELEQRVSERTFRLEERARQLQVVTEVARTAASFQDLDRLLNSSSRLISESFGFYHVGIFLIDEEGQYLTLRAANSEEGQRMLDRMYTLPVDLNSIVGYAAKTQTPRIALDTDTDTVYFNNPDLPETHSEMALPFRVGMRLIGVLDVKSLQKEAFSEEDISILGTLGDQLAVAIDNTRLLAEARNALVTAEQTYERYFSETWSQFTRRLKHPGYQYQSGKVLPLSEPTNENKANNNKGSKLNIPLLIRGRNIGMLEVQSNNSGQSWTAGELTILEATAERAALALESARLLEDAQRRAAKEQIIGEVSTKIGSAINLDNVLQTALREMGRVLPGADISIQVESLSGPENL